jgi:hypothetical protein
MKLLKALGIAAVCLLAAFGAACLVSLVPGPRHVRPGYVTMDEALHADLMHRTRAEAVSEFGPPDSTISRPERDACTYLIQGGGILTVWYVGPTPVYLLVTRDGENPREEGSQYQGVQNAPS